MSIHSVIHWNHDGEARCARWRSESDSPPASRVVEVDDRIAADAAYGLACQGTALLWRGDFQNARQLLIALANRADRALRRPAANAVPTVPAEAFHRHRQGRSQRARTLGSLLVELDANYGMALRRAPDIRQACVEVWGPADGPSVTSLRTVLGLIGAHQWRVKGLEIPAIGARIHPHYGVFAPIRSEYVDLVATTPLPALTASKSVAFDIGTGTGVLAAVLARRGLQQVIATDLEPRALRCARENVQQLRLADQVEIREADLFPEGTAALVVCNPPWLPGRPGTPIERGIYDADSRMLQGFLKGLPAHLSPGGEGWLILSDLAEHLGLRTRAELLLAFEQAQLKVLDRNGIQPRHSKAADKDDPLHWARAAEVTSLWRLAAL